ncbi:MAG: hypothetical protein ACLSX2_01165 [Christensenellaceae bacterium]
MSPGKSSISDPQDERYSFSGRYLCSPSLAVLPSGALVASMDVYAPREPQNLTLVMISRDGGASWRPRCQLFPCFWGKLFVHAGALYMLGVSTEYGDLLIARSDDEGASFSAPTRLIPGSGRSARGGVHRAPVPVVEAGGRLYTAVEWGGWRTRLHHAVDRPGRSAAGESWHVTPLTGRTQPGLERLMARLRVCWRATPCRAPTAASITCCAMPSAAASLTMTGR